MNYTDTEINNENWKDIFGYDGMYQVSDLGRVRSLKFGKTRVMRARKDGGGYLGVNLSKNGKKKTVLIHRLVAQTFIPNDDESKIYINHIDECKQNNRMGNLEYCTAQYNANYNNIQYRRKHPNYKRNVVKDLYDPNLTYKENLEVFKANGVDCSIVTLWNLRKDLGLIKTSV